MAIFNRRRKSHLERLEEYVQRGRRMKREATRKSKAEEKAMKLPPLCISADFALVVLPVAPALGRPYIDDNTASLINLYTQTEPRKW